MDPVSLVLTALVVGALLGLLAALTTSWRR